MLNVIMLNVIMLSVIMLIVIMLSVIMLSIFMLSVIMLSIFMLSVMATVCQPLIYLLDFFENPDEVESGKLLQVLDGPHPAGQKAGEQLGVFGDILQASRNAEKK
jgi:hypothetical protein